jgi:hypothetical protein
MKFAKTSVNETRTSEQIVKVIRGNLAARLAVTPNDTAFLLAQYDQEKAAVIHLGEATKGLLARAEKAEAEAASMQANSKAADALAALAVAASLSLDPGNPYEDTDPSTEPLPAEVYDALTSINPEAK